MPNLVSEIIRYQTPVLHMRRTARSDIELAGRSIAKGDKVVMWYISGNRDEDKIDRADEFIIDRAKPRQHLAFGAGIHRCVGDRLAEQQIRILWEEILNRDLRFEIIGPATAALFEFHPRHSLAAGEDCDQLDPSFRGDASEALEPGISRFRVHRCAIAPE